MDIRPAKRSCAGELRRAVRSKYREVAETPGGHFAYAVGRDGARALGYDPAWFAGIPEAVVDRFVGVGNPFSLRPLRSGERVLDVGCGAGLDVRIAAGRVGTKGIAVGLDLTLDMLAAGGLARSIQGSVEQLPFEDGAFDVVLSNGVLNLVPDKSAAFAEIRRVLRAGGTLAAADLVVVETVPEEVLSDPAAWAT